MKRYSGWIAFLILLALTLAGCGEQEPAQAVPAETLAQQLVPEAGSPLDQTARWLLENVPEPVTGSVGGEWVIFGLARSGAHVPEGYFEGYYERLLQTVEEKQGVLHARKYTEYSRVALALTAIGKDPRAVGGYDLLAPLADYEQTLFQGINGPIFALLALDSGSYDVPENQAGTTREAYVEYILSMECEGGGWSLAGGEAEADLTAMAIQALAKYQSNPEAEAATQRALEVLSRKTGEESCESVAQMIVALAELNISPEDPRFVQDGKTLEDRLLEFRLEDGSFRHLPGGEADLMATEQAFYAMAALARMEQGVASLYTMAH